MTQYEAEHQGAASQWSQPVDIPVGEILRRARAHYGLSLPEVEQALRIRASQLEALETMDMTRLPGRVYAIGFVRSYSEFLGLDGGRMVHLFKTQVMDGGRKPELNFHVHASESKVPNLYILGSSMLALVLLVAAVAMFRGGGDEAAKEIPPVSIASGATENVKTGFEDIMPFEAAMVAALEPAAGLEESASTLNVEPVKIADELSLEITDASWIEIRNKDGETLISRVFQTGDRYVVPTDEEGLKLSTGNAGGIDFIVNGETLPKLGEKGDVLRHVDLTPELLLEHVSPNEADSDDYYADEAFPAEQ